MPKRGERARQDLPPEMLASVRDHVDRARKANRWTNRDAAERLGVDIATLSKISNLKGSVGIRTLIKLRNSLNVSMDALLGLPPLSPVGELRGLLEAALDKLAEERSETSPAAESSRNDGEDSLTKRVARGKKSGGSQNPAER